jgi:hypothetical protein
LASLLDAASRLGGGERLSFQSLFDGKGNLDGREHAALHDEVAFWPAIRVERQPLIASERRRGRARHERPAMRLPFAVVFAANGNLDEKGSGRRG